MDDKVFIDRNPYSFTLMIDYIRNHGQLHEQQQNNYQMLQMELKYWGIDEMNFNDMPKSKFDLIQEVLDRPYQQYFESKQGNDFFFKNLENSRHKFENLYNSGALKFKDEFRIRNIKELVTIEYG